MNAKQTIPVIANVAPPLLFGVAIYYGLKWLFSDEDTEKKPETAPLNTGSENNKRFAVASVVSVPIPPISIQPVPETSTPLFVPVFIPLTKSIAQPSPLPFKRNIIMREDMADAFQHGGRSLTRTAAVAALNKLGFGKTTAYEALLEDGRFSTWLKFAPDGMISWTDARET
jgi:hypothetical protein